MALKINLEPYSDIDTSIGKLYLFELKIKNFSTLEKLYHKYKKPTKFFKAFLPHVVHFDKDFIKKDKEEISIENIENLTKEDLEKIAKRFLQEHIYLYKEHVTSNSKIREDGIPVINMTIHKGGSDEIVPKKEDDTYIDFLYKSIKKYKLKQIKSYADTISSFSNNFSSSLSHDLGNALGINDTVKNHISKLNEDRFKSENDFLKGYEEKRLDEISSFEPYITQPTIEPIHHDLHINLMDDIKRQEEKRLEPFKDLSAKLDLMIDAQEESVSSSKKLIKFQADIATELKQSSDSADKHSLINIKFTKFIIILTVISTLISSIALYISTTNNDSKNVLESSKGINSSLQDTNTKLDALTKILIKQNQINQEYIKQLEIRLAKVLKNNNTTTN